MRTIALLMFLCVFLVGCINQAQIQAVEKLNKELTSLYTQLDALKKAFESGELKSGEFVTKTSQVLSHIKASKGELNKLQEGGMDWGQILLASGIAFFARGLPSKGPIGMLVNAVAPWRDSHK